VCVSPVGWLDGATTLTDCCWHMAPASALSAEKSLDSIGVPLSLGPSYKYRDRGESLLSVNAYMLVFWLLRIVGYQTPWVVNAWEI
jgi:hypothetical protein